MIASSAAPADDRSYKGGLILIGMVIAVGLYFYIRQLNDGLGITGLGRDVSWGLYIAQFAYSEGLAGAAVVVLLPCYLHGASELNRVVLIAVLLTISATVMCLLFIVVDLGQPARIFNVLLHPTPWSMMFWDMVSLGGYLILNIVIALALLEVCRTGMVAPSWLRPVIIMSLPWGIAVHVVSAFLFSGLPGRSFWDTAILAPRFLASAFATSSASLLLICLALRRLGRFDAGDLAIVRLGTIATYALAFTLFFMLPEAFTTLYGRVPEQMAPLAHLYLGFDGHGPLASFMWSSLALLLGAFFVLLVPRLRVRVSLLALASVLILIGILIDKGFGFVVAGFVPSALGAVPAYAPTAPECAIAGGVWGIGALLLMVTYRIALTAQEKVSK